MSHSQFNAGSGILYTGYRGDGKTDMAFLHTYIGLMQSSNFRVLTNVVTKETKYIKVINNDIEMFNYLIKFKDNIIYIMLDEGAVIQSSKRSMSNIAIYLDSFFYLIRKFNASLQYIVQRDMSALASARELSNFHYHKISKTEAYLYYREYKFLIKNIPKSPIDFDTRAIASFDVMLDFQKIFKKMSGVPIEEAYKILKKILKNPEGYYNTDYLES